MLTYLQRAKLCANPTAKKLFEIIETKKSNLALSADVTKKNDLLRLAETLGPFICVLKTHIDILEDFDFDLIKQLQNISEKHNFLIFEDRKFADIGNTVSLQYGKGIYRIADWAHITNAHILPGPGVIAGLKKIGLQKNRGLLLLAEMSSKDNLFSPAYIQATVAMAKEHQDFVIGFIAQKKLTDEPNFIHMTPGVKLIAGVDALGQQYVTPTKAILENGSDIIIVGRGIYESADPVAEAKKYQKAGWQVYQQLLQDGK